MSNRLFGCSSHFGGFRMAAESTYEADLGLQLLESPGRREAIDITSLMLPYSDTEVGLSRTRRRACIEYSCEQQLDSQHRQSPYTLDMID